VSVNGILIPAKDEAPLRVTREVTRDECPWLRRPLREGQVVYCFGGTTYGCVDYQVGTPCSFKPGENPFFEVPTDALEPIR
jgi:hypothetical protein